MRSASSTHNFVRVDSSFLFNFVSLALCQWLHQAEGMLQVKEGLGNKWHIPWGAVTSLAIVLLGYGSCVAYLQIVGDNFKDIGGGLITYLNSQPWWFLPPIPDTDSYQRNIPILVLAIFVALPCSLPREMKALEPIATFGVTCMVSCARTLLLLRSWFNVYCVLPGNSILCSPVLLRTAVPAMHTPLHLCSCCACVL